jgi:hypothetical protein
MLNASTSWNTDLLEETVDTRTHSCSHAQPDEIIGRSAYCYGLHVRHSIEKWCFPKKEWLHTLSATVSGLGGVGEAWGQFIDSPFDNLRPRERAWQVRKDQHQLSKNCSKSRLFNRPILSHFKSVITGKKIYLQQLWLEVAPRRWQGTTKNTLPNHITFPLLTRGVLDFLFP